MQTILVTDNMLNIWWVLMNILFYYVEIDFLLQFTGSSKRQYIPSYIILNSFLTGFAIWTQMFQIFSILHIVLLFFLFVMFFKVPAKAVVTPAVIIFTLSTFMEGFVTVFMRYFSLTLKSQSLGFVFQFLISAGQILLFFLLLRFIAKRYPLSSRYLTTSSLHIVLLPCVVMTGAIRISLGLDSNTSKFSHGALINGDPLTFFYAMLLIAGTFLVFFMIIEGFHKITVLSQQTREQALLANVIKEQRGYIDEAQQQNKEYRSFHHDINNHLLVLSGLLHAKQYKQAEHYLYKLDKTASDLSAMISTGNSALDVLLWEKIRLAEQYKISVTCAVRIPKEIVIDDIDLCILFSNAMDNAIKACMNLDWEQRIITLTVKQKYTFLLIELVNSIDSAKPFVYGTGLKNIKLTAHKYAGVIHTEQTEKQFSLSILLPCNRISENHHLQPVDTPLT